MKRNNRPADRLTVLTVINHLLHNSVEGLESIFNLYNIDDNDIVNVLTSEEIL